MSGSEPHPRLTLAEAQARFQAGILANDDGILSQLGANARTDAHTLFGVYRRAYLVRLIEVLRAEHPKVAALLGEAAFAEVARDYFAAHPSRTPNARWLARSFPEFLATTAIGQREPAVAELAGIERAMSDAFDAADDPVLSLNDLSEVSAPLWASLVFVPHSSVTRLTLRTNALDLWQALANEAEPLRPSMRAEPQALLVWRHESRALLRAMAAEEAHAWDAAARGSSFGQLCELATLHGPAEEAPGRVASHLAGWLAASLITRVDPGL